MRRYRLSGDQLIGVVIIDWPAPRSTLNDVISDRANEEGRVNGFDAGYRYPALMAGSNRWRVIRSAGDRGVVLIDQRFRSEENLQHTPVWWDLRHLMQSNPRLLIFGASKDASITLICKTTDHD